ncbi:MAG TPA: hypothetical protein VGM83_21765 [Devosiaceae bacterium]
MNKQFKVFGSALLAGVFLLSAWPAAAQSVAINLDPHMDYRTFCTPVATPVLSYDWTQWDGTSTPTIGFDRMYSDASIYLAGGTGTLRNRELAARMLDYLAKSNWGRRDDALYQLGRLHLDPSAGAHDTALAVTELQQAVSLNNSGASTLLGKSYLLGEDLPQDDVNAEHFLKIGATANDVDATMSLAKLYFRRPDMQTEANAADTYLKLSLTTIYRNIANGDCGELNFLGDLFADSDLHSYDPAQAIAWYEAAYNTGNIDAAVNLAKFYMDPQSPFHDTAKAASYLEFAASTGRISAMVDLAELQLQQPTPDNTTKAMAWLETAAANQEMPAYETLVSIAQGGYGGTPDYPRAFDYLSRAAQLPNVSPEILLKLAKVQEQGEGTVVDRVAAYDNYKRAAALGSAQAYVPLYDLSTSGVTTADQAIDFLRKGADAGQSDAMARLGDAYMCGVEVPRDPQAATQWYDKAAAAGNVPTIVLLGQTALKAGDKSTYFDDIKQAAEAGDAESMILLSDAYTTGTGTTADAGQAKIWHDKAIDTPATRARALVTLARLTLNGSDAAAPDAKAAESLLQQAASLGDPAALYALGSLYATGYGSTIVADPVASRQYMVQAANDGNVGAMVRLAELKIGKLDGNGKDWQDWLGQAVAEGNVRAVLMQAADVSDVSARRLMFDQVLGHALCDPKDLVNVAKAISPDPNYKDAAAKLAERAVAIGSDDPSVLYQLGDMIGSGLLGADRVPDSIGYLQRAADDGKVEAMRELGKAYYSATIVPQDIPTARKWLLQAARAGDSNAVKELGDMVASLGPDAVGLDDVIAALKTAANTDPAGATVVLASVLSEAAVTDSRYEKEANEWLVKAADAGDGSAMLTLSNAFALGLGVDQSDEQSAHWLKAAAEAGYPEAYSKYAMVLELGLGTPRDADQARYWLDKSTAATAQK